VSEAGIDARPRPVSPAPAPAADPITVLEKSRRRWLGRWLGAIVSVVTIGGFVAWALRQEPPHIPTSASALATLAGAVLIYAGATVARGWRWQVLLKRSGVEHDAVDAYALVPVGYMGNTVLPARGGELLRVILLAGRSPARKREVGGSIVAERLLDAVVLAVMFAALTWVGIAGSPVGQTAGWLAAGGVLLLIALGAVGLRLRRHPRIAPLAAKLRPFVLASAGLLGPMGLVLAAVTAGVWCLEGVVFHLVGTALDLPIGWIDGLFLVVLTSFFALIPAGPAYAGTFDTAAVFGLKALSITASAALSFALLVRAVLFIPITLCGFVLVITRYGGWAAVRARRAEARE
jgi:uncharacterized membrane protein YbhN (UPF0104 family)